MKIILWAFSFLVANNLLAQNDSLPSGVYSWSKAKVEKAGKIERRQVLKGSTLDLENLEIHTSTLLPGEMNHPLKANMNGEELIIIKDGSVKASVEDSTKILGPGGLILLMAGDKQSFINISEKPVTYFVLVFKSKDGLNAERGKAGGGSFMKDWNDYVTLQTDKGQSRPIFDRPSSAFKRFDVHATALNPGFASHLPHTHRAEEIILMIKGNGEMQIGEKFYPATPGDVILVNSLVPHAIKNTGNTPCGYFAIQWHSNAE
ncbi:MAG: cupin protein [Segetibacter sp.]|nr:cupin protein [Segetibacter sp.]